MRKRLAVFVSGGGTNMQSIIDNCENGVINGEVALVISSNDSAYALSRAKNHSIPAFVCKLTDFSDKEARDEKILLLLLKYNIDFCLLAGYLGIITSVIIDKFPNRVINIHPALLPKFGGENCYGLNVHKQVIEAGEKESGATVHFVDCGTDTGLIIDKMNLPVEIGDTAESLQKRILETIEHKLFTRVIKDLCDDKIFVINGKVVYNK